MSTMKLNMLSRDYKIDTREGSIDEESRTVEVSFSSETPVERSFGTEILDHSNDSVRLGRLNNGGAVLVDHDRKDHVGVVESATLGGDRRGRALLRFGQSARATEIFQDVKDGIRNAISVGYRIYEVVENTKEAIVRATDWEPYEISIVSIAADDAVGIGRDVDENANDVNVIRELPEPMNKERSMTDETQSTPAKEEVDVNAIRDAARKQEQNRIREITSLGARHELPELATSYINDGKSIEDFRAAALDELNKRDNADPKPQTRVSVTSEDYNETRTVEQQLPVSLIGLTPQEASDYSLMRAIRASLSGDWSHAGFERECSVTIAENLGREAQGFFMPWEVQNRAAPMSVGTATEGAELKGTDHLAGSFIENLYNNSVVMQAGATTLPGLVGDVDIPAQTGSYSGWTWLAEGGTQTAGVVPTGTVTLAPTTIGGAVSMTRRLLKQSAPSVEALVMSDLIRGAALAIDLAALEGDGTGANPEGVAAVTGVNTQAIADLTNGYPTWAELVGFETATATDNALQGSLSYITTSAIVGGMKTTAKDAGSGIFLMNDVNGMANGYPVRSSNQITAKAIYFGNWSDLLIGMWGVLDIMPDKATLASSGGLVLWAFQDVDVAVRHAVSFCKVA